MDCGCKIKDDLMSPPHLSIIYCPLHAAAEETEDQLTALLLYGWDVAKHSLFDEEGVEGWVWTDHRGDNHIAIGGWDELPGWPDSAKAAFAAAKGE